MNITSVGMINAELCDIGPIIESIESSSSELESLRLCSNELRVYLDELDTEISTEELHLLNSGLSSISHRTGISLESDSSDIIASMTSLESSIKDKAVKVGQAIKKAFLRLLDWINNFGKKAKEDIDKAEEAIKSSSTDYKFPIKSTDIPALKGSVSPKAMVNNSSIMAREMTQEVGKGFNIIRNINKDLLGSIVLVEEGDGYKFNSVSEPRSFDIDKKMALEVLRVTKVLLKRIKKLEDIRSSAKDTIDTDYLVRSVPIITRFCKITLLSIGKMSKGFSYAGAKK